MITKTNINPVSTHLILAIPEGFIKASEKLFIKLPLYFCIVNLSALMAWIKYFSGHRQEIWEPSKR